MVNLLTKWAANQGVEIAWGPSDVVADVAEEIDARRRAGELDEAFDRERLSWFGYPEGMPIPDGKSVIMIAVPRPAHTVTFTFQAGPFSAVIPPTYVAYEDVRQEVRQGLAASVFRGRYRLEVLPVPLKAVAARLGLVSYGRNNITYSPRYGSYHQLVGMITDAKIAPVTGWRPLPLEVMSFCESCQACLRSCPTGAIARNRFLLHAERCLTYHNEGSRPWPKGLAASAHHCLVGCMACQSKCPVNADLLRTEPTDVSFSEEETAALLAEAGPPGEELGRRIRTRLAGLGMAEYGPMLGRNLRALVARRR
ncbi:MAG: 4Fe-4S double cluster binding domain-containing protein [Planctomycetota bacterium]|jgi:epoxyqueuosine reductase